MRSRIEDGTLVLFTNYTDLKYCYQNLLPRWQKLGRSVYAQGEGVRSELEKMIEEQDVLLLGARDFEGFDARPLSFASNYYELPFENPSHPVLEAKTELLVKQGKAPLWKLHFFGCYSVSSGYGATHKIKE